MSPEGCPDTSRSLLGPEIRQHFANAPEQPPPGGLYLVSGRSVWSACVSVSVG